MASGTLVLLLTYGSAFFYEACRNKEDAGSRELYLKSGMAKRYLKNRLKRFLSLTG